MAQAVFDEHPIEQYLRDSGEVPELMPGGAAEFSREPFHDPYHIPVLRQWLQRIARPLLNTVSHVLESTGLRSHSPASEFAERFKYIVISSPLLASSLASAFPNRAATPTTPGHYAHSVPQCAETTPMTSVTPASSSTPLLAFSLACLIPAALVQGYYLSGVLIFAVVKICSDHGLSLPASLTSDRGEESWSMTLESLEALVSANNAWDSVFSEALGILEIEERNALHPSSPSSQSPSLRIAFSSSLHTTQTQCDNVRQLLSALTSPVLLSQLSEMYAPPSPSHMHTFSSQSTRSRPISFAAPALHRSSSYTPIQSVSNASDDVYTPALRSSTLLTFPADKRSTWNGSYMSLAGVAPRRQRRRSNLSTIIRQEDLKSPTYQNAKGSSSVPPTPSQPLSEPHPVTEDASGDADAEEEPFGIVALDLRRKRRSTRALLFEGSSLSPRSPHTPILPSISHSAHGSPRSSASGSRFTTLNSAASSSRQSPLSLSNLHLALHGALSAKRFACAHLLALRFSDPRRPGGADADGEDESYWEDVRSVIGLLASTLEDASARLSEALADATREDRATDEDSSAPTSPEPARTPLSALGPQSFAPLPSYLSRFSAHIDAISAALDDAREHLHATVASLRDSGKDVAESPAALESSLESYERLRRELGLALRECERGRGTLVQLVQRGTANCRDEGDEGDEDSPVRHDEHFSSGESDKTLFNLDEQTEAKDAQSPEERDSHEVAVSQDRDDASAHLIMTSTSQHLPPPGIEQVFESLSAAQQPFTRERSKLTREERIRLAKERRESGSASTFSAVEEGEERRQVRGGWGPGGEVVQELKDVIWKVGEQRRKMVERSSSPARHKAPP